MSDVREQDDYIPGNPATRIIGKPEEQPARRHRKLPPKPHYVSAKTILADIRMRRQELEPMVSEYKLLLKAVEVLKGI
jgi:hypothetical protein